MEARTLVFNRISKELIGIVLIAIFLFLLFFVDFTSLAHLHKSIPKEWLNVNTIFLSIFFEAIPFILLGVIVSSIIQVFVTEDMIRKVLPKSPIIAVIPAAFVGIIFPMCECVIIPIVRRLIQKGLPLHVGIVILVSAPIMNPIVFLSTFYAFQTNSTIVYARFGITILVALLIGLIMYYCYRGQNVLKDTEIPVQEAQSKSWKDVANHTVDEFFDTGKYLLIGACLASLFQTFFDRNVLDTVAHSEMISPVIMMGFGYVLSICSAADAFIAASFGPVFSTKSLLAFLVFGPMLDIKNTFMLFAYFQKKFVFFFIGIVILSVYIVVQLTM
ncbi:permease [Bacillus clarus]|uniref:Permease n=1 Tax=Bacillus clarus TaxID=2338372 RepID=A0ABX9L1F6_9BACI|nr:permease [Bacillus clarus]RFT68598.1 permease [Bacillus clarus]